LKEKNKPNEKKGVFKKRLSLRHDGGHQLTRKKAGFDVCEIWVIKERRLGQKMNCAPTQRVTNHRTSDLGSDGSVA
jgi:hypothetical protein